jgi:hypothetical protein
VGLEVIEPDSDLLVVTEKGFGKRTPLGDYNPKGRGTMGMATIDKKAIMVVGPDRKSLHRQRKGRDHIDLKPWHCDPDGHQRISLSRVGQPAALESCTWKKVTLSLHWHAFPNKNVS